MLETAKKYKNPNDWSGLESKTKGLALEPDTYELDTTGKGVTAEFDYEVIFRWTSHYVHSTVSSLERHVMERGDVFRVRGGQNRGPGLKHLALFNVLAYLAKTFVYALRAMREEQPEVLQEVFKQLESFVRSSGTQTATCWNEQ